LSTNILFTLTYALESTRKIKIHQNQNDGEVVDAIVHTMIGSFFFDAWMILRKKLLMPSCTQ